MCKNSVSEVKGNTQPRGTEDDEDLEFYGYKSNIYKTFTIYFFYLITLGLLRLFFHWFPTWRLYATHSKCSLKNANKLLIVDRYQGLYKSYFVEEVKVISSNGGENLIAHLDDGTVKKTRRLRVVCCKKLCYVWDDQKTRFVKLSGLNKGQKCFEYHNFKGYTEFEQATRLCTYGKNEIDVPVNTILGLIFNEVLTPFYFFQVFSLVVWFLDHYYYYTVAIIVMSVFGIASSVMQTRQNQQSLRKTVHSSETIVVCRGNEQYEEIPSYDIVPGDVIAIPKNGCTMQCDAVLITGSCIVNESMLTGESVPVPKSPIPKTNALYNIKEDSFHTLFCGTKIIQTRSPEHSKILAVVIRTGFLTSKGELVRSILYPTPTDFKFDQDSYKVIAILTAVALLGAIYTVVSKSTRSVEVGYILLKALDLITIVIPPALPAAMTVGKLYALHRLKKQEIFCMNSRVINVSGTIDCMCFDKTGTLTEDGLDMWGVLPSENKKFREHIKDIPSLPKTSSLVRGMAACQSLTLINEELIGDPLDIKMFESTGWCLKEDTANNRTRNIVTPDVHSYDHVEIVRQFPFSSNLQRMSVITRIGALDSLQVFCKGSPEMISSLSVPDSIPINLHDRLKIFTQKGYRVIAVGSKTIPDMSEDDVQKFERTSAECNLVFAGLVILENRMKAATPGIIRMLKDANIRTIMITGDNIETAVSVAKDCEIINGDELTIMVNVESVDTEQPCLSFTLTGSSNTESCYSGDIVVPVDKPKVHYAMSGTTWGLVQKYFPEQLDEFVLKGVVFARMSGLQKQQLIQELKKQGYYTGMVGDGANDCGALKTAHVGISLSEEESSVASPFTSRQPDISCVSKIIREGRGALATSMGIFKFMICYSCTQFISAIILYGIDDNLTSLQFLFVDLAIVLNLMSTFGKTRAYKGALDKNRPLDSLLSFTSVASILFQLFFVVVFLVGSYNLIQTYAWFVPFEFNPNDVLALSCYENYSVYLMSLFQYIIMMVSLSKGKPYRQPIYTNKILFADVILVTGICLYILFYPAGWVISVLDLTVPPEYHYNLALLGLIFGNFICSLVAEDVIVGYFLTKKLHPKLCELLNKKFKNKNDTETSTEDKHLSGFINHAYRNLDDTY